MRSRELTHQTLNNQNNKGILKGNKKSPENNLKDMEICDLDDRVFKTAVLKNSARYKKIQKGNLTNSEIKSANKRST